MGRGEDHPPHILFPILLRPLAVFDQVVDDGWVGEGAGVAELVVFVGGDFAENAAHDFAASGFG